MTARVPTLRFANAHLRTGVRLRYAEAGEPGQPPVVLLHGLTDSWFSFSQVLPALGATCHAFALDQRGHGNSDRPERYGVADFAADVLAFLDALDLPRVTLVGHSMGSIIAQQVALDVPERVERLVLVGAAASVRTEGVFELRQAIDALEDPVPAEFAREFQLSTIHLPVPGDFLDRVVTESLKLPARVWQGAIAGLLDADSSARLGEITMPTLILWGAQDTIFDRAAQEQLLAGIGSAVLKTYAGTGHALHWERPATFVRDLVAFITAGGRS